MSSSPSSSHGGGVGGGSSGRNWDNHSSDGNDSGKEWTERYETVSMVVVT